MSKISIEGNASGTGTLTIAAPNTNTNYTLTLPENTGTIVTTGGASALTTSGNLTFTGTGNRITGDFSNATVANRVAFQTSTTNGNTGVFALPNGTGTVAAFRSFTTSDPTNSSFGDISAVSASDIRVVSGASGTGTNLPMTFYTGGSERMRIDTSGNVGIGVTSPDAGVHLRVFGNATYTAQYGTGNKARFQADATGATIEAVGAIPITFYTNSTERMRIASGGGVSIGTTTTPPSNGILLPQNGVINTNGGTLYSNSIAGSTTGAGANMYIDATNGFIQRSTSSIKYKTDIEDLDSSLSSSIYQMRPVWYRSLGEMDRKDWSYYGLIAEEVGEIEPRLVHWGKKEDGTLEAEGVMYDRLTVFLLAEMKKLKAELDQAKARIEALENNNA